MNQAQAYAALRGLRVLVIEDGALIADLIAMNLDELGCEVVGPVGRLAQGMEMARTRALDGALLDVNLADELSFPIADILSERGIPFIFLTGYGASGLPAPYRPCPRLTKPFQMDELVESIALRFARRGPG